MTVPAPPARRRPLAVGRVLPLLLLVALLAPMTLLFVQAWRLTADDRDLASRERLGVEYLRALAPVTDALVNAQSAAVAGRPASGEALTRAVEAAASVDARIGDELHSQERWAGLRARIEALGARGPADPEDAFAAYGEATDLLLALYRKIRETSGLVRDPRSDSFFLQDGVGEELPEAVVAAGRLVDLALLADRRPAADRNRTTGELAALRMAALTPAGDLATDLRAAVDSSESADLGPSVLTPLDAYQRAVEALAAHSAPGDRSAVVNQAQLVGARLNAQTAAGQLQPVILGELDALLAERVDALARDRWLTVAAGVLAALLWAALGAVWLAAVRRARRRAAETRPGRDDGQGQSNGDQQQRAAAAPENTSWQPGAAGGAEPRQLQPVRSGGEPGTAQWGPFDAAR
ncbi:hypothetical protein OG777_19960 [Micromonospora peucetia]|uniref:hypothetical protein n=1 Tax=Micromonospora peucetia TaxID=47871 RepID=UPI00225149FA|nr:hypothetical protein [Micromonospora peucetia]MCX4389187.1 hypothetical protein [Micromonospora peucetia]